MCGLELHDPERLKRHTKKAHGNIPEKKLDPSSGAGGTWYFTYGQKTGFCFQKEKATWTFTV